MQVIVRMKGDCVSSQHQLKVYYCHPEQWRMYVRAEKALHGITSKLQRQSFSSEEVPGLKPLQQPFSLSSGIVQSRDTAAVGRLDQQDTYLENRVPICTPIAHNTVRQNLGLAGSSCRGFLTVYPRKGLTIWGRSRHPSIPITAVASHGY